MKQTRQASVPGLAFSVLAVAFTTSFDQGRNTAKTDAEIKLEIVGESFAKYVGNCPCPYSSEGAGRCGKRSAYDRPGAASPICYADGVTQKMAGDHRKRPDHK